MAAPAGKAPASMIAGTTSGWLIAGFLLRGIVARCFARMLGWQPRAPFIIAVAAGVRQPMRMGIETFASLSRSRISRHRAVVALTPALAGEIAPHRALFGEIGVEYGKRLPSQR
jgi:hypothetical protein